MPQDPLSLLCLEPCFPGRLGPVADWLVRKRGYRCQFYCAAALDRDHWPPATGRGLDVIQYQVGGVARQRAVHWTRDLERGLCHAYACWEVLHARRPRGIDIVLARSAHLGSSLFVHAFQPGLPIVNFFDYYHHPHAHDVTADLGPDMPPSYFHWRRTCNAMDLLDLENGVRPWTATAWQRDLFPPEYRNDFLVLHPGVAVAPPHPDPPPQGGREKDTPHPQPLSPKGRGEKDNPPPQGGRGLRLVGGRSIPPAAHVVSFVARRLDRLRGFDRFVALANRLLADDADVLCIAAGGSPVSRGLDVEFFGQDYAAHVLNRTPPCDPSRFWLLGAVRPSVVAELLAASDLHVYPSRPYPPAQSLLEALAAGRVVLAWDSEPIREILTHGQTGLLVPAGDAEAAFQQARAALRDPAGHAPLGQAAAELVRQRYATDVTLPILAEQLQRLVERGG